MNGKEITDRFSLDQLDHHELLHMLSLRYGTSWRISDREITLPASHHYALRLRVRHGRIEQIFAGSALSLTEFDELLDQLGADLLDEHIAEFGVEVLFAPKPVEGGFRFSSLPMQLLPPPAEAPRPPQINAHHPFLLEFPIRASRTPDLKMMRRRKKAMEWTWVLNALLNGAIITYSNVRPQQLWAFHGDVFDPVWSTRSYSIPGGPIFADSLSDQDALLPMVPAAAYFGNVLNPAHAGVPLDSFSLPDNLDDLVAAFLNLNDDDRRRFLRVATTIYLARQLWETSISSYFLGCVQAIETLIDPPERVRCPTCNRDTGPGAARLFREFVQMHCTTSGIDEAILKQLYKVRSALAHGDYLFQLDEAPWALNMAARVASDGEQDVHMAALTVAKTGLRSWLMKRPGH